VKLWIGNLPTGTTAEKVEQLLRKYGLPQPDHVHFLDGTSPGVLLDFWSDDEHKLRKLIWRIEGLYWEGSHITVSPLHSF
jgi:RNA recognition motif-containing protein